MTLINQWNIWKKRKPLRNGKNNQEYTKETRAKNKKVFLKIREICKPSDSLTTWIAIAHRKKERKTNYTTCVIWLHHLNGNEKERFISRAKELIYEIHENSLCLDWRKLTQPWVLYFRKKELQNMKSYCL